MDNVIVGIIVAGAIVLSIRSFVKICRGEGGCGCETGCSSCSSNDLCGSDFPVTRKK